MRVDIGIVSVILLVIGVIMVYACLWISGGDD